MSLTPITPTNEASVTLLLERTHENLVEAIRRTDIVQLSVIKAQTATVHEATKQLGLSKDIQFDAEEMVRRSEFWLGKAIRAGQIDGTIATRERNLRNVEVDHPDFETRPVTDFGTKGELYGSARATGLLDVADGFADEADFEAALTDARAEGNLSRANVARKAREQSDAPRASRRKPLPDFARDAGWELRKAVERLERIAADDRFGANKELVASHLRGHLNNAVEVCQDLLDRINNT